MSVDELIERIDAEWDRDEGFFGRLRRGRFDPGEVQRVCDLLSEVGPSPDGCLHPRLVALTWYIPSFMLWQRERVEDNGGDLDAYKQAETAIMNVLEGQLGTP